MCVSAMTVSRDYLIDLLKTKGRTIISGILGYCIAQFEDLSKSQAIVIF